MKKYINKYKSFIKNNLKTFWENISVYQWNFKIFEKIVALRKKYIAFKATIF